MAEAMFIGAEDMLRLVRRLWRYLQPRMQSVSRAKIELISEGSPVDGTTPRLLAFNVTSISLSIVDI